MEEIHSRLALLKQANLLRTTKEIVKKKLNAIEIDGVAYLNFCSNDYLGLSGHKGALEAAKQALDDFGAGATASRLICGTTSLHVATERLLARLKKREAALLFPTGYMANLALFTAITTPKDAIVIDRLAHASIVDAVKLSAARLLVFEHNSPADLDRILTKYRGRYDNLYVATEAVFSMDGDIAPLPELISVCEKHKARLIIDEAHSTGVLGKTGKGIEEYYASTEGSPIIMGTCSKALGVQGGFICSSQELIDYMVSTARPFIYTTGIAPALCGAIAANIEFLFANALYIDQYHKKLKFFRKLIKALDIPVSHSESAIFPLVIGDTGKALAFAECLKENHILALAIREPTVPPNTARIRIAINAAHTCEEIEFLAKTLVTVCKKYTIASVQ
ncbi:MAG: 8-amino-7-oxononanoate synthase [Candidatus Margulisiibacteriota bacterium]|nr:MAG: hypothetical protein A2X43_05490 [Candidatus Margulisbacteria bacterium GWD2_39_127]OGI04366.1 MAG: hypothetical protein A2X42_07170 [Candidatus Margulisbacteria bacterium GWF2_38_17]OGI07778.1 MAG: hypothetical protein A2X41_07800 [Candidatus Margulisbacteria bacterium GWE2_39_32]PZM84827.1 MAG: 8-amino-7-oxononanoate synthase [Candidatus Margulisiibacteriota bacterium]HAR63300.1 8-amino-7-oxononanoate synthase [Candidatus Margulisiibacteriota bacterium]